MATLLPNGEQTFLDANGTPLAGGFVYFYVPNSAVVKDTWQDSDENTLNTNPVELDAAGRAIIYGSGSYRQVVKDADGNLIWDQLTADTAVGGIANGGTSSGSANAQVITAGSFSFQDGQFISFVAGYSNSGALTVNAGAGAVPVLTDSATGPIPCSGGEVVAQNEVLLVYELARGAFHIINPTSGSMGRQNANNVAITGGAISGTTIALKQSATPTPTAEGDIQWDTDDNQIKIGDGAATKTFSDDSKLAVLAASDQTISGGAQVTPLDLGTVSSGTTTLNYGSRPIQMYTNNGAHTLAPDSDSGYILLLITNGASAGAITTSGWTAKIGAFTTTNAAKFLCSCATISGTSSLSIQAL